MGQILWLRPWPLLLLLHRELLLRLQFFHPSPFLPRRVLKLRGLVSSFLFLLRSLLPKKEVTPTDASQIGSAFLATPLVIFASDPFIALS